MEMLYRHWFLTSLVIVKIQMSVEGFELNGTHHNGDANNLLCERVNIIYRTTEYYLLANEKAHQK